VAPPPSGGTAPATSTLTPHQAGSVDVSTTTSSRITFLGHSFRVTDLRRIGLVATVLAALACIGVTTWLGRRRRSDDVTRFGARHAHDLVPVSTSPAATARLVVDVANLSALARLADRYDCVILELEHAGGRAFYLECGATVHRCGPDPATGLTVVDSPGDAPSDMTYFVRRTVAGA